MVQVDESNLKDNYKTLHKDFDLIEKPNHKFDLNFNRGDLVPDYGINSVSNGIIVACLVGWNELKRAENPVYYNYGNHAYELLKENKSTMVDYKVEQYFKQCLNQMRRIKKVNSLTVTSVPFGYNVYFNVSVINDDTVTGNFNILSNYSTLKTSILLDLPYPETDPYNNLDFTIKLVDELGNGINEQVLLVFVDDVFVGSTLETNVDGYTSFSYVPQYLNPNSTLNVKFKGNEDYDASSSASYTFVNKNWVFHVTDDSVLEIVCVSGTEVPLVKLKDGHLLIDDIEENKYFLREGDVICQRI